MLLETLLGLWVALFAWFGFACWRAPLGFEDRAGFHWGSAPQIGARGSGARGRRRRTVTSKQRSLA
jgi:hypothetical protein